MAAAYLPFRFKNGVSAAAGDTTFYTVPAGQTAIINHISVTPTFAIAEARLYLAAFTAPYGGNLMFGKRLEAGQTYLWQGFYVALAGDQLLYYSPSAGEASSSYLHVTGLLGSGLLDGLEPFRVTNTYGTTGDQVLYTVPAGRRAIIKTLVISNPLSTSNTASLRIEGLPISAWPETLPAYSVRQYDGSWIMESNERILANVNTAANVNFHVHGMLI